MRECRQCPRACGADRAAGEGFCRSPEEFRVGSVCLHRWEEPVICGGKGAGAVFFAGCNLRCAYCQNRAISRGNCGKPMTGAQLAREIRGLQERGATCVDLVTPTHYTEQLIPVLREVRPDLRIPVVWNSGGYEKPETLRALAGLVDIYLPDCKYFSDDLAGRLSGAAGYFEVFCGALREMLEQVGKPEFSQTRAMTRGVIVRHLVLPGHRKDSIDLLKALAERFGSSAFLLSLMSQYTPDFAADAPDPALHRRLTSFEYQSVLSVAETLGFDGFLQDRSSADRGYTPAF